MNEDLSERLRRPQQRAFAPYPMITKGGSARAEPPRRGGVGSCGDRQPSVGFTSDATASGRNPLNVIQTPTLSSHTAIGRVRRKATAETCSKAPNRVAMKAAKRRGAPIRPRVGMMRGTRRDL